MTVNIIATIPEDGICQNYALQFSMHKAIHHKYQQLLLKSFSVILLIEILQLKNGPIFTP